MSQSTKPLDVLNQIRAQSKNSNPTNSAKFNLGAVSATPRALALLSKTGFTAAQLIERHASGDWGECGGQDAAMNETALTSGERLFSFYRLVDSKLRNEMPRSQQHKLPTVWIITNAANDVGIRDYTTLMTPECY